MAEETTYLIEKENGRKFRITVPSSWKVTFGPAAKGIDARNHRGYKVPLALRFYENETKQRAIFTDVVGFRDMSIHIEEERTSVKEKEGYVEVDGKRKATTFQARTTEWVNPDADTPDQDLLEDLREEIGSK